MLEPVEPERRASGQFADRAERNKPVEQPPRAALGICPPILEDALRESSSSSACKRRPSPFGAQFRLGRQQLLRPPAELRRKIARPRRPLGVREHDGRLRAVGAGLPRAPTAAGEHRRGKQGQRERPIEALGQHASASQAASSSPSPRRPPRAGARRLASARAERRRKPRRGEGAGRMPSAPASAASMASSKASSCGTPKTAAAAAKDCRQCPPSERTIPARRSDAVPPARIGPRPGEKEGVAQGASSSVRPARRTLAAAALIARRRRQTPAQGGFSRTIASRRPSAAPARKAASASDSGVFDRAAPRQGTPAASGRKALDCLQITAREHARNATARRRFWLGLARQTAGLVDS